MGGIQEEETEVDETPLAGDEFRSKTPIEEAPFEKAATGIIESEEPDANLTPIQRIRKSRSQKSQMSGISQ